MSNIRYELTEEESVNFRPKLLYLSTSKFESDWHSTPHYHPFSEIMFITGGAGTYLLDKKVDPISRGDLVVVSPNIMHTEYSSADSPLEYMIIGVDNIAFDLLVEDEESESDLPPTIFHFFNHYDKTYYYLQELNKELVNKRPNYQIMSQHIVNVLLLYIMRHSNLKTSIPSVNKTKYVNRECAFVKQSFEEHAHERYGRFQGCGFFLPRFFHETVQDFGRLYAALFPEKYGAIKRAPQNSAGLFYLHCL